MVPNLVSKTRTMGRNLEYPKGCMLRSRPATGTASPGLEKGVLWCALASISDFAWLVPKFYSASPSPVSTLVLPKAHFLICQQNLGR